MSGFYIVTLTLLSLSRFSSVSLWSMALSKMVNSNSKCDKRINRHVRSTKRGLDLGLSRGFSGSQAAKHLMGLAAANYAGGPGRRRRSEQA